MSADDQLQEQLAQLLSELEAQTPQLEFTFDLRSKFSRLVDIADPSKPSPAFDQLRWEFNLFSLHLKNRFDSDGLTVGRFHPMFSGPQGIFPDPNGFPPEAFAYFEQRVSACTSPLMRARYCDFLWEHSQIKDRYKYAKQAVYEYLETLKVHGNPEAIEIRTDALQRSADLALTLDPRKPPKPLSEAGANAIRNELVIASTAQPARWLLDVIIIALAMKNQFEFSDWDLMVSLCDRAIAHFETETDFLAAHSFLDMKLSLYKVLGKTDAELHAIRILQAEAYIHEGETRSRTLEQAMFLESSIKAFLDIGEKARAESLIAQMKEAHEYASEHEYGRIPIPLDYDESKYAELKASLGTGAEFLANVSISPSLFPNWEAAVRNSAEYRKTFPLLGMLGGSIIGQFGYPIRHAHTEEEITEDNVMRDFGLTNLMKLQLFTRLVFELRQEKGLYRRDFNQLLRKIAVIDPDLSETIACGIDRFFRKDYVSSLYILTIQLEDYLRKVLYAIGRETTVYKHSISAFQEKTLEPILRGLKEYLPESLYRYIVWVLDDDRGFHLRDHLAHGFIKKKDCDIAKVMAIMHIIVLLTGILRVSERPKEPE